MKYVKQLAKGASRNTCPKSRIKQMNVINVLGAENKVPDVTVVILVASFVIDLIKPVFPLLTDIHKYTNKHTYMHVIYIIYIYAYNIFIIVYIYIYILFIYVYPFCVIEPWLKQIGLAYPSKEKYNTCWKLKFSVL